MSEYIVEEPNEHSASWRVHERIVRCRDCIYPVPEREPNRPEYKGALWCELLTEGVGFPVWPDCYCCWGERKVDA